MLQVHHTYYKPELYQRPWDYPLNAFEVLCQGCHAKEHGHIMPTDGWEYIDCEDMEEPSVECEYPNCTYEGLLRYVHTVYHPKWGYLNVGCGHADKLTGTNQASEVEKKEKQRQTMLDSFVKESKWQKTGNIYSRDFVNFPIVITQKNNTFHLTIYINLPEQYQTLYEAQKAAFNICYNQSPQQFFQQHNIPYPVTEPHKPRSKKNPIIYRDQLTYAVSNRTGELVHIDSVQPDSLCNCVCPACGQLLKADNTHDNQARHRFLHINESSCSQEFYHMYRRLALQLIAQNKQLYLPALEDANAELFIPERILPIDTLEQSEYPYDAIITSHGNQSEARLGIVINLGHGITTDQEQQIKASNIPCIQVTLIKQYNAIPPLKFKELQLLLLDNSKICSWLHNPEFSQQVEQLLQEKQSYLNKLHSQIQQDIDNCITGDYSISDIVPMYDSHDKYPTSVKRMFSDVLKDTTRRIITEPTPIDLQHTDQCMELIHWFQQYETIRGINFDLVDIMRHSDLLALAKQKHNQTQDRMLLLHNLFGYYFYNHVEYSNAENAKRCYNEIRQQIQIPFSKVSPIYGAYQPLSDERKIGMELHFLLYLYYGVTHFNWNTEKKEYMYSQINKTENMPIFAAIGSLWFGHIFTRFETDDLQTFIQTIATQYPQAAPWVLTYIENTNYNSFCQQHNISLQDLGPFRDQYYNKWIAAALYSTLPYYYENNNRHTLFPKPTLPSFSW